MDIESRERTLKLIHKLKYDGISTIVTSHEPHFAKLLSDDHRHLCKTGPSRYTIVEPFLYQGYHVEQRILDKQQKAGIESGNAAKQKSMDFPSPAIR